MTSILNAFVRCGANKSVNGTEYVYNEILPDKINALLEIGIGMGGSMRAWCEFYPDAKIFGIDIDPGCTRVDVSRATTFIGDVSDAELMAGLVGVLPMLDVIVDDGSHKAADQQAAFEALFPILKPDGVYVIEDLHVATVEILDFLNSLPHDVKFHREYTATIERRVVVWRLN